MTNPMLFPILQNWSDRDRLRELGCPLGIPWALVAPHERQADRNHGQTLRRLAERGGLCPREMAAVFKGLRWRAIETLTVEDAVVYLKQVVENNRPPAQTHSAKEFAEWVCAGGRVSSRAKSGGGVVDEMTKNLALAYMEAKSDG